MAVLVCSDSSAASTTDSPWASAMKMIIWSCSSRVDQCDAIENGYSTRLEPVAQDDYLVLRRASRSQLRH